MLSTIFSWNTKYIRETESILINTLKEDAFQKYCLMLDCILPFKDKYKTREILLYSEMLNQKQYLENVLNVKLEIVKEREPNFIFTHGHYIENPVDEDTSKDCPF